MRKSQPDKEIEQICAECRLKETKPGREPLHLSQAIQIASELEEDSLVCSGFAYPEILDYLDPLEWVCLVAIKAARSNSDNNGMKDRQRKAEEASRRAELERLSHR